MAKKQVNINESAAAAAPARAAKPRAPRVKAAQHSKTVSAEPVSIPAAQPVSAENPHDAIARIAYSLWEARGYEEGSPVEHWLRAEQKYRELTAK
jgi:hypothetical protein